MADGAAALSRPVVEAPGGFQSLTEECARLDRARSLIEDRFLDGGAALTAAYDIVARLLEAVDGVTAALGDGTSTGATRHLFDTMDGLGRLASGEEATRKALDTALVEGRKIFSLIHGMQTSLRYLATCAMETRIAGAGIAEFAGFADDVANYVGKAGTQVGIFSSRVSTLVEQLDRAGAGVGQEVTTLAAAVPEVSSALTTAAKSMEGKRAKLVRLAERAGSAARGVQDKVAKALSALQIGDVTRQRIEHIQTGLSLLDDHMKRATADDEREGLLAAAHVLFGAQVKALATDFDKETRGIVASIEALASDAEQILALTGSILSGDADPVEEIEAGIARARTMVIDIEAGIGRADETLAATRRVTGELMGNLGSIGNLRDVRDDIRCLAINAFLKSDRLGAKGRAVGVVASEMNAYATKLGSTAEGVLGSLSAMEGATLLIGDRHASEHDDLAAELGAVAGILRDTSQRCAKHVEDLAREGEAVAQRIGRIAGSIDFRSELGEILAGCRRYFGDAKASTTGLGGDGIAAFSAAMYATYTMAREREVHLMYLPAGVESMAVEDAPSSLDDSSILF